MRFGIAYGTRPEYIKVKNLHREYAQLVQYRQHTTLLDLECCESDVRIDLNISEKSDRLNGIVSAICKSSSWIDGVDGVFVQGDTTTAMAVAIAAANKRKLVFHVEAGLRTHNKNSPFPEEMNRQIISRVADYHFCPTEISAQNLRNEGVRSNIFVVGNTGLDNLNKNSISDGGYILATLHRRENKDSINSWLKEISNLSKIANKPVMFVRHPSTVIAKEFQGIKMIDPINSDFFREMLSSCSFVVTDSGGIQEEASFFCKKVIVCRDSTERPEGIDTGHLFICKSHLELIDSYEMLKESPNPRECPYGNGDSSSKIWSILNERISNNSL